MPPILFLDIDGVLATMREIHRRGNIDFTSDVDEYGYEFRKSAVDNLGRIISETGCKIVLSSAWRAKGLPKVEAMWKHRGYPGEFLDVTGRVPTQILMDDRSAEILKWVNEHKDVTHWCAIDDECLFMVHWRYQLHRVYVKQGAYKDGLTAAHADRAIRILTRP